MKSYQQAPCGVVKKTGRKRETSPYDPYKRKARGKETRPGSCQNPSKTARARADAREVKVKGQGQQWNGQLFRRAKPSRYEEAGAGADELIRILGGKRERDRRTWAYYCYHHNIEILLDKAYEIASRYRQGEIQNPVTAFQRWLKRSFGKEAV